MAMFSRIFSMCLRLLESGGFAHSLTAPTRALPLDPSGGLPSPDPLFCPLNKFLATPLMFFLLGKILRCFPSQQKVGNTVFHRHLSITCRPATADYGANRHARWVVVDCS